MGRHDDLSMLDRRLTDLQGRIERLIYLQLGFPPVLPGSIEHEEAAMDAACEAVEDWAAARAERPDLVPETPLQQLLEACVETHEAYTAALKAARIGR